jgi:hypothetical protein
MQSLVIEIHRNRECLQADLHISNDGVKTWMGRIDNLSLKDTEWLILNSKATVFVVEIDEED